MYEVIRAFRDSKHNDHLYEVGDSYPVSGSKPTKARIEELLKGTNKYGRVYLKEVDETKTSDPDDGKTPNPDNGNVPPNEDENARQDNGSEPESKDNEGNGKA